MKIISPIFYIILVITVCAITIFVIITNNTKTEKLLQNQKTAYAKLKHTNDSITQLIMAINVDKKIYINKISKDSIDYINLQKNYKQIIKYGNQRTFSIATLPHDSNTDILSGILNKGIPKRIKR